MDKTPVTAEVSLVTIEVILYRDLFLSQPKNRNSYGHYGL